MTICIEVCDVCRLVQTVYVAMPTMKITRVIAEVTIHLKRDTSVTLTMSNYVFRVCSVYLLLPFFSHMWNLTAATEVRNKSSLLIQLPLCLI